MRKFVNVTIGAAIAAFVYGFAVLPAIVHGAFVQTDRFALFFGGTSLLIIVVVTMDFMTQVQAYAMSHQYEGLLKKANFKGSRYTAK